MFPVQRSRCIHLSLDMLSNWHFDMVWLIKDALRPMAPVKGEPTMQVRTMWWNEPTSPTTIQLWGGNGPPSRLVSRVHMIIHYIVHPLCTPGTALTYPNPIAQHSPTQILPHSTHQPKSCRSLSIKCCLPREKIITYSILKTINPVRFCVSDG